MKKIDIAPRLEYSVFSLSAPTKNRKERLSRAKIELSKKYPFEPDEKSMFFVKNGRKKDFWICFVWLSRNMQKNYIVPTLYAMEKFPAYSGNVCFAGSDFIEYISLKNGTLVSSFAERRKTDEDIDSQIHNFYGEEKEFKVLTLPRDSKVNARAVFKSDNKKEKKRLIFLLLIMSFIFSILFFKFFSSYREHMKIEAEQQKLFEEEQRKKIEAAALLKKQVEEARSAYVKMESERHGDIFLMSSVIYDCLGKDVKVSNLSMSGKKFELDVYTPDSVKLLSKFEGSRFIENIKLNRSVKDGNREYASFSGSVCRYIPFPDDDLPDEEKLLYYRQALDTRAEEDEMRSAMSVSEYAAGIRSLFSETKCQEDYIQIKPNGENVELECFLKSGGSNIFDFLMKAEKNIPPIDFLSVRIKNSDKDNTVTSVLNMNTGIKMDALRDEFSYTDKDLEKLSVTPVQIGKVFGSGTEKKSKQVSSSSAKLKKQEAKQPASTSSAKANPLNLIYVGEGNTTAKGSHIFFKDVKNDVMYSIPMGKSSSGLSDWCEEKGISAYEVHLDGYVYEVKK